MHSLRRSVLGFVLFGAALIAFAACSAVDPLAAGSEYPVLPDAAERTGQEGNRLLVKGTDGNVYTMDPDGANVVAHTIDASDTAQYLQPTWSPDADRIAWTRSTLPGEASSGDEAPAPNGAPSDESAIENALVVASARGDDRMEYEVPFPPFYISWGPNGSRLAYLSSWSASGRPSMALRLVNLQGSDTPVETLAEGQPFYFSWSPDGNTLLTHSLNERMDLQQVDGSRQPLPRSEALFPAPQWFPSGRNLLYAVGDATAQRLVVAGLDGAEIDEVTRFDGNIAFTLSPDEEQIAYVVTQVNAGTAAFAPLFVVERETGATRQLSDMPVVAFFWSPDAEKLAFLEVERESDDFRFRWRVWDGSKTTDYGAVLPTQTFFDRYLAFFDQYAQSMTIWSPDSTAFVYAGFAQDVVAKGSSGARGPGIWVQELDAEEPRWVGPGVYAAWSPK